MQLGGPLQPGTVRDGKPRDALAGKIAKCRLKLSVRRRAEVRPTNNRMDLPTGKNPFAIVQGIDQTGMSATEQDHQSFSGLDGEGGIVDKGILLQRLRLFNMHH